MSQRADFIRVRRDGRVKVGRYLLLSTLEEATLPGLRYAIITTRKVGKAHDRNRLRRQLRAILQRHGDAIVEPARFLVMVVRPGAAAAEFSALEREWLKQARRLSLIAPATTS